MELFNHFSEFYLAAIAVCNYLVIWN